jgi:hypothetical protein
MQFSCRKNRKKRYRKQALKTTPSSCVQMFRASDVAAVLVQYGHLKIKTKYHQVSAVLAAGILFLI